MLILNADSFAFSMLLLARPGICMWPHGRYAKQMTAGVLGMSVVPAAS